MDCIALRCLRLLALAALGGGDDLRIIARLLDVETGLVVHTVKIDGSFDALFGLQDRVAAELSDAIRTHEHPPSLAARGESARVPPAVTPSPAAAAAVVPSRPSGLLPLNGMSDVG